MTFQSFSKNGKILPIDQAMISLEDIEYQYGFGVYETIKIKNKKAIFIDDHIERLLKSAHIIHLEHIFDKDNLQKYVSELIDAIGADTFNLKLLLIGAKEKEKANLYILPFSPLFPDKKWYKTGVALIAKECERAYPTAKSLDMLQSYILYSMAIKADCYDCLLINKDGKITEGTRTNFFVIKNKTIFIPPIDSILFGVTMKWVLHVAKANGYMVEERSVAPAEFDLYDGAFITSTSSKILPVKKVNDFEFTQIPSTVHELLDSYDQFLSSSV